MASYTIEDIELIRRKSGISYQEAVALLDYHNGNVARALVDLERNGRIRPETAQTTEDPRSEKARRKHTAHQSGFAGFLTRLYQFRLKVKKDNVTILNFSLIFSVLAVIISPHLALIGALLMLALGYHISFDRHDADFATDDLERMVRNAGENVKETVNDFAKGFESAFSDDTQQQVKSDAQAAQRSERSAYGEVFHQAGETVKQVFSDVARSFEGVSSKPAEQAQQPVQNDSADERSYYASNPAAMSSVPVYDPEAKVPTIQVPMQVESQDGNVRLDSDRDGYHSATVE